jgi:hypothetical protein
MIDAKHHYLVKVEKVKTVEAFFAVVVIPFPFLLFSCRVSESRADVTDVFSWVKFEKNLTFIQCLHMVHMNDQ